MTENVQKDMGTNTVPETKVPARHVDAGTNTQKRDFCVPRKMRTYADVASSSDNMEIDSPPTPAPKPQVISEPAKTKKTKTPPTKPSNPARTRAVVVHGFSTKANLPAFIREIEIQKRKAAIGGRWLSSKERRQGKTASSVVLFFFETIIVKDIFVRGRKHGMEVYDWNRKVGAEKGKG